MNEFVGAVGNRSASDDGSYIVAVKEAVKSYEAFCNFKRDPRYQAILEHVNAYQGMEYLEIIKKNSPSFLDNINLFKDNDIIGNPNTFYFKDIGLMSPTTLRYMKVASDLKNLFGEDIGENIAEIGVGYGGQLLVSDKVLKFKQYDLFDLPPVLELTSKYLECHILNNSYNTYTLNKHPGNKQYDLVISNYAFSELPTKLQIMYISKIMSKSKRGYLTMNSGKSNSAFQENKLMMNDLIQLLPKFEIIDEQPNTHPGNYIIVWNKN